MTESQKLLAEYAASGSEAAFRELVTRYLDLVYSAAIRLVEGDVHLAQDVAQTVFADLARVARTLSKDVMLGGWLHRHTCFVANKTMRGERRRQSRERRAVEMNALQAPAETELARIGPILDEAINQLGEIDRRAILLRFFEQHDFRSVGAALGSNEDAARMRVARALEKLRSILKRRGVTTGAAGLSLVLSTSAIQAAPAGLAATISTAILAETAAHTSTAVAAAKVIAMTTFQKAILAATLAAALGTGIYESSRASLLREEAQSLRQQQTPVAEQVRQLQRERDDATSRLAAAREENERLKSSQPAAELLKLRGEVAGWRSAVNDPEASAIKSSVAKLALLKQRLEQTPGAKIPELQFLTEKDWLNAAKSELKTDQDFRWAFASLRNAAEAAFAPLLQAALRRYLQANHGQYPTDLSQVQPFFKSPVDGAILQRWQIVPGEDYGLGSDLVVTQKGAVDETCDVCAVLTPYGNRWEPFNTHKTVSKPSP